MNQNPSGKSNALTKEDKRRIIAEESAILAFTEEMLRRMDELNISKTQMANKLEVEPAFISKLIGGENNFTIKTMVKIARALQSRIKFALIPITGQSNWAVSSVTKSELVPAVRSFAPTNRLKLTNAGWRQYEKACAIDAGSMTPSHEHFYA
jgi:plasmid maintenance system antidote protein VapI